MASHPVLYLVNQHRVKAHLFSMRVVPFMHFMCTFLASCMHFMRNILSKLTDALVRMKQE